METMAVWVCLYTFLYLLGIAIIRAPCWSIYTDRWGNVRGLWGIGLDREKYCGKCTEEPVSEGLTR